MIYTTDQTNGLSARGEKVKSPKRPRKEMLQSEWLTDGYWLGKESNWWGEHEVLS